MNVEPYFQILAVRHARGKLDKSKYIRMMQQLTLWGIAVVPFDPSSSIEEDWSFDEDERDID